MPLISIGRRIQETREIISRHAPFPSNSGERRHHMRNPRSASRLHRVAIGFDVLLTLGVAASYPLYVHLYALPRADEFGPPVPDRYPWAVAFVLVSYLGFRCKVVAACVGVCVLLCTSAVLTHTDAADVTGVARSPLVLSVAAIVLVFGSHTLGRAAHR